MKTKLVYVIVCKKDDVYFEQAYVSAWSAKYHNPSLHIAVVIDPVTKKEIPTKEYNQFLQIIDEEIVYNVGSDMSNMELSRWLKTSLRKIVRGDFVYLDVDTIVCDDLSYFDQLNCSIGFVSDFNCTLKENRSRFYYKSLMKSMFNQDLNENDFYFNGGMYYSKDNEESSVFFETWHQNWLYCRKHKYYRDQLALLKTTKEFSQKVTELAGEYNCQVSANLRYFNEAKILHFYKVGSEYEFSPFLSKKYYRSLREKGAFDDETKQSVINCKSIIIGPTLIMGGDDILFIESKIYHIIKRFYLKMRKYIKF